MIRIRTHEIVYSKFKILNLVGRDILLSNDARAVGLSDRLSEKLFLDLFSDLSFLPSGSVGNNQIKFALYVYAKLLSENYIKEFKENISGFLNVKYDFWMPNVHWRFRKDLKDLNENEKQKLISDYPFDCGYLETIDWVIRKEKAGEVHFITKSSSQMLKAESCKFNMRKLMAKENELTVSLAQKYEDKFGLIRKTKMYLTNSSKESSSANKVLFSLVGKQ